MLTMPNCPHCGQAIRASKPKKAEKQIIIERDGKTLYGRMVNYTTGPQMAYASFPDTGKSRKRPEIMQAIIEARAKGEMRSGYDWFPAYVANITEGIDIETRYKAPFRLRNEGEDYDEYYALRQASEDTIKAEKKAHIQKVFNS